jgi:hypothetical protein
MLAVCATNAGRFCYQQRVGDRRCFKWPSPELQAVPVVLQMAVAGAASDSGGAANEGWWSYQGSVVELQSSAATVAREQQ